MSDILTRKIDEFRNSFGSRKLRVLCEEFRKKAGLELARAETLLQKEDFEQLRLAFHNLKSSSKIFGMNDFSDCCARIEEMSADFLSVEMLENEIKNGRIIFERQMKEVTDYLKRKEND